MNAAPLCSYYPVPEGYTGDYRSAHLAPGAPPLTVGTAIQVQHYRGTVERVFLTARHYLGRGRYAVVPLRNPLYLVRLDLRYLHPPVPGRIQVYIPEVHRGAFMRPLRLLRWGRRPVPTVSGAHPAYEMRVFGDELSLVPPAPTRPTLSAALPARSLPLAV